MAFGENFFEALRGEMDHEWNALVTETYYDEQGRSVSSTEYHRGGSKK